MSKSLLDGFINNWKIVKNTSHAGIQETFLQREGVVSINQKEFRLQVDIKTVDVLLRTIPWSISLVKLPWMRKGLSVEWL